MTQVTIGGVTYTKPANAGAGWLADARKASTAAPAVTTTPSVTTTPAVNSPTNNTTSNTNVLPGFNSGVAATQTQANTAKFKPIAYSAPNKKQYVINDYGTGGASFIGQDGVLKQYASVADAQKAINEGNAATSGINYNNLQAKYNDKMAAAGLVKWNDSTADIDTTGLSDAEATKYDALKKSLQDTFSDLSFDNSQFKDTVQKNMTAQLAKNQALQDELSAYKNKVDADFAVVSDKFDKNTKASLERIDELEKTYMAQLNKIKGLQSDYYNTQMQATNERVAGEQAGMSNKLSAAGVNEFALGNAMGMARTKYAQQFADIKNDNINVLTNLNNAYRDFANDINKQRDVFSAADLALIQQKFNINKTIQDTGTKFNNELITSTFKPYEDAITAVSTSQSQEMGYQASDKLIAERYNTGTTADKESLLQSKFAALGVTMYGKGDLSKFDIAILKRAATLPNYAEALQYLMNQGSAVAGTTAAGDSVIAKLAAAKKITAAPAAIPEVKTETTPMETKVPVGTPDVLPAKPETPNLKTYSDIDTFVSSGLPIAKTSAWANKLKEMSVDEMSKLVRDSMRVDIPEGTRGIIKYLVGKELEKRTSDAKTAALKKQSASVGGGSVAGFNL